MTSRVNLSASMEREGIYEKDARSKTPSISQSLLSKKRFHVILIHDAMRQTILRDLRCKYTSDNLLPTIESPRFYVSCLMLAIFTLLVFMIIKKKFYEIRYVLETPIFN